MNSYRNRRIDGEYSLEEYKEIRNNKFVIVFFTATWCGPCKEMYDQFEYYKSKCDKNMILLKVDVDASPHVKRYCNIQSMPTFKFYLDSVKQKDLEIIGAWPEELDINYKTLISRYNKLIG